MTVSRVLSRTVLAVLLTLPLSLGSCRGSRGSGDPAEKAVAVPAGGPAAAAKPAEGSPPASSPDAASAPAGAPASPPAPPPPAPAPAPAKTGPEHVVLHLQNGGRIVIDLFEEDCPAHCDNFKRRVRSGYYDGMAFFRVCPGFAQAGDPTGTGRGGATETVPSEIKHPHVHGAVAARREDESSPQRESHGSQFFIMRVDWPKFNGQYTVFGQVIEGLDLVDRLPLGEKERNYLLPGTLGAKVARAEVVPARP